MYVSPAICGVCEHTLSVGTTFLMDELFAIKVWLPGKRIHKLSVDVSGQYNDIHYLYVYIVEFLKLKPTHTHTKVSSSGT